MKIMKKLSVCVFALFIALSNASAYTQDVTIDRNNIDFAYLENADTQYVALKGTLKNSDAKVYLQEIQVTKEVYDKIQANSKARGDYIEANDPQTEEEIDAYNTKIAEYDEVEKGLIPSFVDANWKQLELTDTTDSENRYAANVSGKNAYFVSWVKVTISGSDYYYFYANCLEEVPETYICKIVGGKYYDKNGKEVSKEAYTASCEKKVCRIENGKYYDNNGNEVSKDAYYKACPNPKTGRNVYYTYGIITVAAAFILYMFARRIKKFSN